MTEAAAYEALDTMCSDMLALVRRHREAIEASFPTDARPGDHAAAVATVLRRALATYLHADLGYSAPLAWELSAVAMAVGTFDVSSEAGDAIQ